MNSLRKASWFPWLSVLLLAVWIPLQAAGCCKLAAVLGLVALDLASRTAPDGKAAVDEFSAAGQSVGEDAGAFKSNEASGPLAGNIAPGPVMAGDHSCCRKSSGPSSAPQASAPQASAPQAGEGAKVPSRDDQGARHCEGGDKGCCIKGAGHVLPGLASTPVSASFQAVVILAPLQGETLPVAAPLLASAPPEDPGPPLYLVHLRLLI